MACCGRSKKNNIKQSLDQINAAGKTRTVLPRFKPKSKLNLMELRRKKRAS
jgi:hypothetical protein